MPVKEPTPQILLYRSGRQKCGHGCGSRIGPHTGSKIGMKYDSRPYLPALCPNCQQWSLIFGAHGYAAPIPITPELAERYRHSGRSVTAVLTDLGMLAS